MEQSNPSDKLLARCTDKERSFIVAYMQTFDIKKAATEAGLRAQPLSAGRELLRRARVRNAITALREEAAGTIPFNETDVALLLYKEATNASNTGTARVAAASKLADALDLINSPDMPGAKKRTKARRKEREFEASLDVKTTAAKHALLNTKGDLQDINIVLQQFGAAPKALEGAAQVETKVIEGRVVHADKES